MFEALPKELQEKVNYSSSSTVDSFYKKIKDKHTTIAYRKSSSDTNYSRFNYSSRSNNSNNKQEKDDKMDIDNLENNASINYITNQGMPTNNKYKVLI